MYSTALCGHLPTHCERWSHTAASSKNFTFKSISPKSIASHIIFATHENSDSYKSPKLCVQTTPAQLIFHKTYLQWPPFKMSHADQKVSASLLPVIPPFMFKRPQKYITSPSLLSCIASSKTFSAFLDKETCLGKTMMNMMQN